MAQPDYAAQRAQYLALAGLTTDNLSLSLAELQELAFGHQIVEVVDILGIVPDAGGGGGGGGGTGVTVVSQGDGTALMTPAPASQGNGTAFTAGTVTPIGDGTDFVS